MGAACAKVKDEVVHVTVDELPASKAPDGPLLVRLYKAENLPSLDLRSESDVYVKAELIDPSGASLEARWPVRWDASNPIWDSARLFGSAQPSQDAVLKLHFFDYDEASSGVKVLDQLKNKLSSLTMLEDSDDYIGSAALKLSALGADRDVTVPVRLHKTKPLKSGPATCTLRREAHEPASSSELRTVFIVRHGESVWNKAQSDHDLVAMAGDTDHPLNEAGRAQSETLLDALRAGGPQAEEMLAAELVQCSPLTRAVQTCLIGLQPMLLQDGQPPAPVGLNPNLREKRNLGGKDSSGKWMGDAVQVPSPAKPRTRRLNFRPTTYVVVLTGARAAGRSGCAMSWPRSTPTSARPRPLWRPCRSGSGSCRTSGGSTRPRAARTSFPPFLTPALPI